MTGWANDVCLGSVNPACHAIDRHAAKRLRQGVPLLDSTNFHNTLGTTNIT